MRDEARPLTNRQKQARQREGTAHKLKAIEAELRDLRHDVREVLTSVAVLDPLLRTTAMPTNVYKANLEDKLARYTRQSVDFRRQLRELAAGGQWAACSDGRELGQQVESIKRTIAYLDGKKAELRFALGLPEPSGAVRLDAPRRGAVKLSPAPRAATRTVPAYVTRAIGHPNCK